VEALASLAVTVKDERELFLRIGRLKDAVFLGLGDRAGRAVRIDSTGWRVVKRAPVLFFRPKGYLPLPMPRRGGKVDDFRQFINLSQASFVLLSRGAFQACGACVTVVTVVGKYFYEKSFLADHLR